MTWAATKKEVEFSNFFKEVPKILKRFWLSYVVSFITVAAMIVLSLPVVPREWRIDGSAWAVIFPLAYVVRSCPLTTTIDPLPISSIQASCHLLYPVVLNPWLLLLYVIAVRVVLSVLTSL